MAVMQEVPFSFGDKVNVDNDQSLCGRVTAFQLRAARDGAVPYVVVELSWMHNGESKSGWFEEWRLRSAV